MRPARGHGPLYGVGLWCQLLVVIVYSATMIEICPELLGSNRPLDPIKHTAAQEVTRHPIVRVVAAPGMTEQRPDMDKPRSLNKRIAGA